MGSGLCQRSRVRRWTRYGRVLEIASGVESLGPHVRGRHSYFRCNVRASPIACGYGKPRRAEHPSGLLCRANDPGDELEQLRIAAEQVKQLPSNDTFRFAGFAETLIRGTGDGDVLSNPNGITVEAEAKEKLRKRLRFFAKQATTSTCTRRRTIPPANCLLLSKRLTARRPLPGSESLSPISRMRPRRLSPASSASVAEFRCRIAWS